MKAVVALGANLDNPREAVQLAIALLEEATQVINISSLYETEPVGGPTQNNYINAVCVIDSDLPAIDLLALLPGIEKSMGRVHIEKWGPRVIDLDLIQYGNILSSSTELELPHPRAFERKFVLEPWYEIEPDGILLTHGPISQLLEELK